MTCLMCLTFTNVKSQQQVVTGNLMVLPPYSLSYLDYLHLQNNIVGEFNNTTNSTLNVYFLVSVIGQNHLIGMDNNYRPATGSDLIPGTTPFYAVANTINGYILDLQTQVQYQGAGVSYNAVLTNQSIPADYYKICISVREFATGNELGNICSQTFQIQYYDPPIINTPNNGQSYTQPSPLEVYVSWNLRQVPPTGVTKFTLELLEIPMGNTNPPEELFNNNVGNIRSFPSILNTSFTINNNSQINLEAGKTYAFRVIASNEQSQFNNNGTSEVRTFSFANATDNYTVVPAYPSVDDTIPFDFFPNVVCFKPYSNSYRKFEWNYELRHNDIQIATRSDNDIWPDGPHVTESYFVSPTLSVYRSQLLPISLSSTGWTSQHVQLIRGQRYVWNAQTSMFGDNSSLLAQRDVNASFVYGMGRPHLLEPSYGASFPPGTTTINLKFITSSAPVPLIPPPVVQADNQSMNLFAGGARERWILEIARSIDFHDIVDTITGKVDGGYDGLGTDNEQFIKDALYKTVTDTFHANANGYYYWRVKWCNHPDNDLDSTSYLTSIIWPFWIGEAEHHDSTGTHEASGPCTSSCLTPEITNRTPITTLTVGDVLAIGKFKLVVKEITNSDPAHYTGKGEIKISNTSDATIKVHFENIHLNSDRVIYDGTVQAENDIPPTWYSSYVENNVGRIPNITDLQAESLKQAIINGNRIVNLGLGHPVGLPIGFDFSVAGNDVIVGVTKMEFRPTIALMDVIATYKSQKIVKEITFGLADQCFTPDGFGDSAKVFLQTDILTSLNNGLEIKINGPSATSQFGTYISYNCEGVQCVSLEAELLFPRDKFLKDNPDGSTSDEQVKGTFSIQTCKNDSGWIARVNMDPFQLKSLPGFGFVANEIWIDFSDAINPAGMTFPEFYNYDIYFDPPIHPGDVNFDRLINTWNGLYIKALEMRLPTFYHRFSTTERPKLVGHDWIIDNSGLSGTLGVNNFIPLSDGNFEKWSASVDSIYVTFASGDLTEFKFTGYLRIPIMDSADSLKYRMVTGVNPETEESTFLLSVRAADTIHTPLYAARLNLATDSYINLTFATDKKVHIEAVLNGNFALRSELAAITNALPNSAFDSIKFQGLSIDNFSEQWFRAGTWSLASPEKKIGGFNFGLTDVHVVSAMEANALSAGLQFTGNLDILGDGSTSSNTGISASTTLTLWGKINLPDNQAPFAEFDRVQLDSVSITGNLTIMTVHGAIGFYHNNATFGNGFKGLITAKVLESIDIGAAAQFGEVNNFKYWYVDVNLQAEVPIIPLGAVAIYGLGGGAYHKMRPVAVDSSHPKQPENEIGGSMSQYTYVPDNAQSWGFLATVFLGTTGERNVFNADATFIITFADAGGISQVNFNGTGRFMTAPEDKNNSSVTATLLIDYTVSSKILDGNLSVFMNLTGGIVKGGHENNLAGQASFHVEPGNWQILIGTPNTPISLEFLHLFTSESYLMIGDNLPPANAPPESVQSILGQIHVSTLGNGDGFAFGMRNHFDTDRMVFLIFYAQFAADLGFDISLNHYNITCQGSTTEIGINGWYAQAAVWAYLMGAVGIHVDVWFFEGDVEILGIAAAAYLGGGLPNPTWMEGRVGGRYNILGGLISGNCNFKVTIGERCQLEGGALAGVKVITDLKPNDGSSEVSVLVNPTVVYSVAIGNNIVYEDINDNGDSVARTFRCIQDVFELRRTDNNALVNAEISMDADNMGATLSPISCLEGPGKNYKLKVSVHWEELINGSWRRVTTTGATETKEITFSTGEMPTDIYESVYYSYPLTGQQFYLQNECKQGVIVLKQDLGYLFRNTDNTGNYTFEARFFPVDGGSPLISPVTYQSSSSINSSKLLFQIPALNNSKIYTIQIIKKKQNQSSIFGNITGAGSVNPNVTGNSYHITSSSYSDNNTYNLRQRSIPGTYSTNTNETQLYNYYFKTSKFNSLAEKLSQSSAIYKSIFLEVMQFEISSSEGFDKYDAIGLVQGINIIVPPLVKFGADWESPWAKQIIEDKVYSTYRLAKQEWGSSPSYFTPLYRDLNPGSIGFPPKYAISINEPGGYVNPLDESQVNNAAFPPPKNTSASSTNTWSFGFNFNSGSTIPTNARLELLYMCSVFTLGDFINIKPKMGRLIGEFSSTTLNNKIAQILAPGYSTFLTHANYGLHSWYMPPVTTGCQQWHYGNHLNFTY